MVGNSPKDKESGHRICQRASPPAAVTPAAANRILDELMRDSPNDGELNQALKNLSARKTLDQGGYAALEGGTGSYRDILKNKKEAVSLEQEKRVVKSEDTTERLIGEYETRLQTEPDNLKLIRSLAELYTQKNQFDRALELYERIKKFRAWATTRRWTRAIANMHRAPVRPADRATRIRSTPTTPNKSRQVQAEKLAFQLAECQKRVEKYPDRPRHPVSRWACCISRPARSARRFRNSRRRRATRTSGSPR